MLPPPSICWNERASAAAARRLAHHRSIRTHQHTHQHHTSRSHAIRIWMDSGAVFLFLFLFVCVGCVLLCVDVTCVAVLLCCCVTDVFRHWAWLGVGVGVGGGGGGGGGGERDTRRARDDRLRRNAVNTPHIQHGMLSVEHVHAPSQRCEKTSTAFDTDAACRSTNSNNRTCTAVACICVGCQGC